MTGYAGTQVIPLIDHNVLEVTRAGLMMHTADDAEYVGRYLHIDGKRYLNFGGCSYLGLEQRPELREGAIRAIARYGTQFSHSRVYVQSPLYEQLEGNLKVMTGGCTVVAASTTLAHMAALPVLIQAGDAVLLDLFAHASLHASIGLLRAAPVASVSLDDMARLDSKVARLATKHRRVWLVMDGLYSMYGDFAPFDAISELLQKHPSLHLYVDDAHSTSWMGNHGRGRALESLACLDRVVVALSLNKAFSAGGAVLVFAKDMERNLVRRCGGPLMFGGPLPPPMLGAAVASAALHLRPDFSSLQHELATRIDLVLSLAQQLDIRFASDERSPVFFIHCGPLEDMFSLGQGLRARGIYVCPAAFPAVPRGESGIRFTVSLSNTEADIRYLMENISVESEKLEARSGESSKKRLKVSPSARGVASGRSR